MIDFIRFKTLGLSLFVMTIFLFCGLCWYKQQTRGTAFLYNIDFTGGMQALIRSSKPITAEELTRVLPRGGFDDPVVRTFSSTEFVIRVHEVSQDVGDVAERLRSTIETNIPDTQIELRQLDTVGSALGASKWWSSMRAVFVCLLAMLFYILVRFASFGFALGAVGSLFHDALLMLTFCLLFDYEISVQTITAILLVLGYSINDTIIIFARIRENMGRMRSSSLETIVNTSINETLRRTLLTVFSTILVVIPLILFGGDALRTLSSMLLVGFVFGTYSSIYIASPIMLFCTRGFRNTL